MTKRLLLDTDVLIDFLRGQPQAVQLLEDTDCEFHVSAVSVAELYVGVRDGREREVLDQLVGVLRTIEISTKIAQQAGLWRREYCKSHGTDILDALIAACADALQIPLATLNVKHFPMLPRVSAPYRK
ncbi:MAG: type II toxin-antitoxin system VapC family toxin [bacterium]